MPSSIHSCSFSLHPLNANAYNYTTTFHGKDGEEHSKVSVTFYKYLNSSTTEEKLLDVYSLNGMSSVDTDTLFSDADGHLFERNDLKALRRAAKKLGTPDLSTHTVFVLDLLDPQGTYLNPEPIRKSEQVVSELMQNSDLKTPLGKRASGAREIFRTSLPIDYVLAEGTLKNHLVTLLSDPQTEFFLNTGRPGRKAFCEFTELFILATKMGYVWGPVDPQSFLIPTSNKGPFQPKDFHIVWYPEDYQEVYSPLSRIPMALQSVFPVKFEIDKPLKITAMTVTRS